MTWCFDKKLFEQARQKKSQKLAEKWIYEQLLGNLLYFSYNFTRVLASPILKYLCTLIWAKSLFINWDTFKRYWLTQNTFSTLKMLSWNLGTLWVSFYRIRERVGFFLESRSNSQITLIKTKCVVIYHGKNNGGNNGYCGQRLR